MEFLGIGNSILAYIHFWKSQNHAFQKWIHARIAFPDPPEPPIFRKSEFSVTPRVVSGGRSAAWFSGKCILTYFLDAKVCQISISMIWWDPESVKYTLLEMQKCVILHFLGCPDAHRLSKTLSFLRETTLSAKENVNPCKSGPRRTRTSENHDFCPPYGPYVFIPRIPMFYSPDPYTPIRCKKNPTGPPRPEIEGGGVYNDMGSGPL